MILAEVQEKLKERLALGLNYGLQALEDMVVAEASAYDEIVTYKSQYNDLNRLASQNILAYEQVESGYNKVRRGLLELIATLQTDDLVQEDTMPQLVNNESQYRKSNFFELLNLHFSQLAQIEVRMVYATGDDRPGANVQRGRAAFPILYQEIFVYNFRHQRSDPKPIDAYARHFFTEGYPQLEVYMKMLAFLLRYCLAEEVEQSFYLGVIRSLLSRYELLLIVYYAISGLDKDFAALLAEAKLLDEVAVGRLIEPAHIDLLPAR